jgi:hypothetical protein
MSTEQTADDLHAAGHFHDPRGCLACYQVTAAENARKLAAGAGLRVGFDGDRTTGPTVVTFTSPEGTETVMQAESVTVHYDPEPYIPEEAWNACVDPHPAQALVRKVGPA